MNSDTIQPRYYCRPTTCEEEGHNWQYIGEGFCRCSRCKKVEEI